MLTALVVMSLLMVQDPAAELARFSRPAAEFDAREAAMRSASGADPRATATLAWGRALHGLLQVISSLPADGPHTQWLQSRDELVFLDEIAGSWRISPKVLEDTYQRLSKTAAADEFAWLIVQNGLPGECEGYVPCYANGLNQLHGQYLRRHPAGAHRAEAFDAIDESLRNVVDDLLRRKEREDYLKVPGDCGDLLAGLRPLRAAVTGAGGRQRATITMIDQLIALCPQR